MSETSPDNYQPEPQWKPLTSVQRRVLGVLMEKARTTPAGYPMSLNAIATGSNQRSNRAPLMSLEPEDVEDALEELRLMGATAIIEGSGRVNKYKHYASEWLGVDRAEAAVLAELMLRGEQTVGELRGRAARMEKSLTDVAALRPVLRSLQEKGLVIALSPEGRGQTVTHGLYLENERPTGVAAPKPPPAAAPSAPAPAQLPQATPAPTGRASNEGDSGEAQSTGPISLPGVTRDMYNELQLEVAELRAELSRLRQQVEQIEDMIR